MAQSLLFDTDILIEYLRETDEAVAFLEGREENFMLSTITIAELFTGVRTAMEESTLERFLLGFDAISVSDRIAKRGGLLRHEYSPSHGTGLADALIATTALESQTLLVTFNAKHYPMLPSDKILVPYLR